MNKLSGVLHSLKNIAERCEDDKLEIEPTTQIHQIEACLKALQLVDTHLQNSNPAAKTDHVDSIKQKLKWPLKKSKVKELLSEHGGISFLPSETSNFGGQFMLHCSDILAVGE